MYSFHSLLDFALLTIVMAITPGPNNIMLLNISLSHGYRKAIPAALGIVIGIFIFFQILAISLGNLFQVGQSIQVALGVIGCFYLFYLAFRIYSAPVDKAETAMIDGHDPQAEAVKQKAPSWVSSRSELPVYQPQSLSRYDHRNFRLCRLLSRGFFGLFAPSPHPNKH